MPANPAISSAVAMNWPSEEGEIIALVLLRHHCGAVARHSGIRPCQNSAIAPISGFANAGSTHSTFTWVQRTVTRISRM